MSESVQASAVAIGDRAILIEGTPGVGKSSLALSLIDRGAQLIGDDGVLLEVRDASVIVRPHPNTCGLIEVRNIGLVTMPVQNEACLCLVIRLQPDAPRFIDGPERTTYIGMELPMVRLAPPGPNLAIKAELALEKFGLAGC